MKELVYPMLKSLESEFKIHEPLTDLKILNNTVLTHDTFLKLKCLKASGAQVFAGDFRSVKTSHYQEVLKLLKKEEIPLIDHLSITKHQFDIYLDCTAELAYVPAPKLGIVELTHTGEIIYKQAYSQKSLNCPVISVDSSQTKLLETFYGTGKGVAEALIHFVSEEKLKEQTWVLLGMGRVGAGIALELKDKLGKLIAIDPTPKYQIIDSLCPKSQTDKVYQAIKQADGVISATGIEGIISKAYPVELFKNKVLANAGALDEFGESFSDEEVLFNKYPINFSLDLPTPTKYLDPVFYAHNLASLLFRENKFDNEVLCLPTSQDMAILSFWREIYQIEGHQEAFLPR